MILNLTQHAATPDQREQGVTDLPPFQERIVRGHLTFNDLPSELDMDCAAFVIALVAQRVFDDLEVREGERQVMIGGAPYFMPYLEKALRRNGIKPLYAFSRRESVDEHQADGTVKKVMVFKHLGFVGE